MEPTYIDIHFIFDMDACTIYRLCVFLKHAVAKDKRVVYGIMQVSQGSRLSDNPYPDYPHNTDGAHSLSMHGVTDPFFLC